MREISYKSPLYIQLREVIRSKIEEEEYLPGTAIPSENQLMETYGLNRVSVRSALAALEFEGLLKSVQGKGVFVAGPKAKRNMDTLGGFHNTMRQSGGNTATRILSKALRQAGPGGRAGGAGGALHSLQYGARSGGGGYKAVLHL